MPDNDMTKYETQAIKYENNSLYWLSLKYHIKPARILQLIAMDNAGRVAILSEPMLPMVAGSHPNDTDVYCPECRNTLSGGWSEEHPEDRLLYQCPHCGQSVNPMAEPRKIMTLQTFWSEIHNDNSPVPETADFYDKNGNTIDDMDYPMDTEILEIKTTSPCTYHITLNV